MAVMGPFHLGFSGDRDISVQPLLTAAPPGPTDLPQHNFIYTPEIPSLYTLQKRKKKAHLCFQMASQDVRFGGTEGLSPGKCLGVPHAAVELSGITFPPATQQSPARKWHSLNMQMSQLISCKFPINYYSLSVSLLVSAVRFQGHSLARSEQTSGEKWSVNIYGLKGETLEFEDLS